MTEMYTSPTRVERDGWLVAFEGEVMTRDEAARRGLLADSPEPGPGQPKKLKTDWVAEAQALGIKVPAKATVDQIRELIEQASPADDDGEVG